MKKIRFYIISLLLISSSLYSQNNNNHARNDGKLIMGVVNAVDSMMYIKNYTPFINYIAKKVQLKPELKVLNYGEIAQQLVDNQIDIGVFSPFSYIEAKIEHPEINLFAVAKTHGIMGYHPIIVVRKDSGINSIYDLQGRPFAFTHTKSTSGYEIPHRFFYSLGIDVKPTLSGSHKNSVLMLNEGKTDGIATYKEAFKEVNVDINNFKIIYRLGIIPNNAYVLSPSLDSTLQQRIKHIMYSAHSDIHIDNRKMFDNDLGIQQWVEADDGFYNDLRVMLQRKRIKHKAIVELIPSQTVKKHLQDDDILNFVNKNIISSITKTKRFADKSEKHNGIDTIKVDLNMDKNKNFLFTINLNSDIESLSSGKLTYNELTEQLPKIVTNSLLESMPIKTILGYDPRNKFWFVPFGKDDGINEEQYTLQIHNKNIDKSGFELKNDICKITDTTGLNLKREDDVMIKYVPQKVLGTHADKTQKSLWNNFFSKLDNIWGVIGIIFGLLTMGITAFFQMRKQRKFKKMLTEANNLLKDYFEGKEIVSRIVDLRATVGSLLENQTIKETQYNVLVNKLNEIQNIVEYKSGIKETFKNEIEEIISDGIITEKEYQRLIYLIKKKDENM